MARQKKSVKFDVPTSIPFLCRLIVERQRINKVRLSATQNTNYVIKAAQVDFTLNTKTAGVLAKAYDELYEDCKRVCKEFSAIMSYVARECGVSMDWGTCHQVKEIRLSETHRIKPAEMQEQAQLYLMDEMLFPELKIQLPADPDAFRKRYDALKAAEKELKKKHRRSAK